MGLDPTILRQAQDFASFSALQITQLSLATPTARAVSFKGEKPAYRRLGKARFPPNSVIRMAWQRGRTDPFRELGLGRNDGNLLWAEARSLE